MYNCVFCEADELTGDLIVSTDLFVARWDSNPVTPGHVLVIPRRHVQYLRDLSSEESVALIGFAQSAMELIDKQDLQQLYSQMVKQASDFSVPFIETALKRLRGYDSTSPQGYNLGLNDGPVAGQSVPHLHLHIMPRWQGDVDNPRGGVRNMLTGDNYGKLT